MFLRALNLAKIPVLIAMIVTPIRFFLELAGLPENLIFIIGLLWLTLAFAVYWGIKLYNEKKDCHLIGRNEEELKKIANKLSYSYSVCDVLKLNFVDKLFKDLSETEILGIAYCVGSIDLKPLRITKAKDFVSSYVLNLVSATDILSLIHI